MPRDPLLTRPFVLGFAANFLHSLAFHSYLHLPGYLQEEGAGESMIGLVMGVFSLSAIASRPFVGRMIDKRGRRSVLLLGSAAHLVFAALYLTLDGIGPWIYAVRVGHGVAEGMLFSVIFTIAADVVPASRRSEGMGLYGVSGMIPLSLAGLIGDQILAHGVYRDLFAFTVGTAALAAAASWFLPDSRPAPEEGAAPARSFVGTILSPRLLPVWFVMFTFAFALASYFTFVKTFVLHRGIGSVGSFFTAYTVAAVLLRVTLGWVPDRFGPVRVLVPAVLCAALGVFVLSIADSDLAVVVAGTLCGIGHGYAFPIGSALVVMRSPPSERGSALAAFTALFDLGLLAGAPVLGLILERSSYATMFGVAAAVAAIGSGLFAIWDRSARTT
jgi:MFS family permease